MLFVRILICTLIAAIPSSAQRGPRAPSVALGHIHLNSADPDATIAFWKDVIGASGYSRESLKGVSMIGALILFDRKAPSGPSSGSSIDHVGLTVPDLQPFLDRLAKTSYRSSKPTEGGDRLLIDGPDGIRIELTEDNAMYSDKQFSHVHFHSSQPKEMQAWYAKIFGTSLGTGDNADSILLPGAALTFTQAAAVAPTAGRAIDHIAFEVKDLESFCKTLAESGIKFDSPYQKVPELKFSNAFLTDPWGTRIELTEGLAR